MNFEVEYFTKLKFGEGAARQTGSEAKKLGITKAMVVCDAGIKNAGGVDPVLQSLKEAGIPTVLFDKVQADPPDVMVNEGGMLARSEKIDGIVAVGGGSSMDTAKAINILVTNEPPINQYFAYDAPAGVLPLIAIPTTAGTGSEVTRGGMVTDTVSHTKNFIPGYATAAIVDPLLHLSMPPAPSVYCAFDAYCHSLESIVTDYTDPISTMYAKESIRLIHRSLRKVLNDGSNVEARGELALAATLAGYAVNRASCHLTHAIGHSIGASLHMPHGLACALCLPQLMERYSFWMPDQMKIVAEAMGIQVEDDVTSQELAEKTSREVLKLMKDSKLPTLEAMGYSLDEIYKIIPMIMKDSAFAFAPKQATENDIKEFLTKAYNL